MKPIIAITTGDTNGIGYEVIIKALSDARILELCTPVVYGSSKAFGFYRKGIPETENINTVEMIKKTKTQKTETKG